MSRPGPSPAADPRRLRRYVLSVTVLGGVAAVSYAVVAPHAGGNVAIVATLFLAMVLSIYAPLRFHRGSGVAALHVNDGILLGLLVVAPAGLAPLIATSAALVGNALRTRNLDKVGFNVGAHGLAAVAATATFHALWLGGPVLSIRTLVAIVVTAAVYNVVDALLYGRLFGLLEERPLWSAVADNLQLELASAGGNALLGTLLAHLVTTDPAAAGFVFVLVLGAQVGYHGYALALEERKHNTRLQRVTRSLTDALGSSEATARALAAVADLFGARSAEMVVLTDSGSRRTRLERGELAVDALAPAPDGVLAEALRRGTPVEATAGGQDRLSQVLEAEGRENALAAPLVYDGLTIGLLAVYDRGGLEARRSQDPAVLASLANDAAIALKNAELFESVTVERARLAEESHKLHDIVDAASDGIALIDADGRIIAWNPAMVELTGIAAEEAADHPWYMALRLRDERSDEIPADGPAALRNAFLGRRQAEPGDLQVLHRAGDWRWVRCTFSPVAREDEGITGVVLVARDVTRERETEELKSDFLATVSHELRTPLTPLKGLLITLLQKRSNVPEDELRSLHQAMLRQVERLANLVEDLLVVADVDRGEVRLRQEPTDLADLVAGVVEQERSGSERISFAVGEPVQVAGDQAAIARIVHALVDNGLKHTSGRVTVTVSASGDRARVAVADEGPGIHPRLQGKVFERFGRLGDHLTRPTQGPGLGLSIARALAEQLGGRLTLESSPRTGSTFTLELPIARPRAVHPATA